MKLSCQKIDQLPAKHHNKKKKTWSACFFTFELDSLLQQVVALGQADQALADHPKTERKQKNQTFQPIKSNHECITYILLLS